MKAYQDLPEGLKDACKRHFVSRLEGMRAERMSFWAHWASLAEMYLPRRYKFLITPNQYSRGSQINAQIVDETGMLCARTCASGMMSGLTSPTNKWYKLSVEGYDDEDYGPVKAWLAEVEERMSRVLQESNFYQALATLYHDNTVFSSAATICYEDPKQVIRLYNPCLGEFFFGASSRLDIDSLYREFTLTVGQAVEQFGLDNLSDSTQQLYRQGGGALQIEVVICHGIEPNFTLYDGGRQPLPYIVAKKFEYRECYWEQAGNTMNIISLKGFNEKPFVGARWDTVSNDAYGRGPGMDALPAVRQLQIEQRRKAEAIDKMVRPPMNASVSMKNEPASILPGSVNYVADVANSGMKPVFTVDPRLQEMNEDIKEVQARINSIFFVDLFMMISQLDTVRTATEIDARREEKLIMLGPVIERFENEVLDPIINRVFSIMARRGLLPEAPPEISGQPIVIRYISMLAEAQRAAATASIERLLQLVGNLAAVNPDVLDNIDFDKAVEEYADLLNVSPEIIRPMVQVQALRQAKAQQQAAAQQAQVTAAGVQGAQTLSQTDVGGGINALQMMLGRDQAA